MTTLIAKSEKSRVAKINGNFEVVEIIIGYGSEGAKIQRENGEVINLDGNAYLETVNMHNEKMIYRTNHPVQAYTPKIDLVKCSCGHSVPSGSVMNASVGTSCPDCYDKLSY